MHTTNDFLASKVVSFIYVCLALFFCLSREKKNEDEDARNENGDDEEAAGIGGGEIEGEEGEVPLCVKSQLFTILMKYQSDRSTLKHCHSFSRLVEMLKIVVRRAQNQSLFM